MNRVRVSISRIRNRLEGLYDRSYEPARYWTRRGRVFVDEEYQRGIYPQHEWLAKRIESLQALSLLEVGCGFGRNLRFLAQRLERPPRMNGVDISPTMLRSARNYLRDFPEIQLQAGNAARLPLNESSVDVVLLHGVLMHQAPEQGLHALCEALRVARVAVLGVEEITREWSEETIGSEPINNVTWCHPYVRWFRESGAIVSRLERHEPLIWYEVLPEHE